MFLMLNEEFSGFSKEDLNKYFFELSKELKKELGRNANIELIVVGGASILLNYDFRESTIDVDAIVSSQTSIKNVINKVGDKYNLPNGWINSDFKQTKSYSPELIAHSRFYKKYNQVLTIRTIDSEYLIAMKLASMRKYKNDRSDIVGIVQESLSTNPITIEKIDKAINQLYGGWKNLEPNAQDIIQIILKEAETGDLYKEVKAEEQNNKKMLIEFENSYENVLKEDNLDNILHALQTKENSLSSGRSRLTTKENLSNMDNVSDVKKEKIRISVKEKLYEMKEKNNEILKKSQAKEKDHEINI